MKLNTILEVKTSTAEKFRLVFADSASGRKRQCLPHFWEIAFR